MTFQELDAQLASNLKHYRHRTQAELVYWHDQWKLLAQQAVAALKQQRDSSGVTEAVSALDRISGDDPDSAHQTADRVLLAAVHPEVRAAWWRVETRARGFWE